MLKKIKKLELKEFFSYSADPYGAHPVISDNPIIKIQILPITDKNQTKNTKNEPMTKFKIGDKVCGIQLNSEKKVCGKIVEIKFDEDEVDFIKIVDDKNKTYFLHPKSVEFCLK